jgi:hypothetical protein
LADNCRAFFAHKKRVEAVALFGVAAFLILKVKV